MIREAIHDLISPVLSDRTIKRYNKKGILFETPLSEKQIQPNSVDLTLDDTYRVIIPNIVNEQMTPNRMIDPIHPIEYNCGRFNKGLLGITGMTEILIEPHQFVLLSSQEILNIPNGILAFVQGRSSIARMGLQTEQAGLIDAGFHGTITFEVFNETDYPIRLFKGMRIAQCYFFKAQYADVLYGADGKGSKYQHQEFATGSMIDKDFDFSHSNPNL